MGNRCRQNEFICKETGDQGENSQPGDSQIHNAEMSQGEDSGKAIDSFLSNPVAKGSMSSHTSFITTFFPLHPFLNYLMINITLI